MFSILRLQGARICLPAGSVPYGLGGGWTWSMRRSSAPSIVVDKAQCASCRISVRQFMGHGEASKAVQTPRFWRCAIVKRGLGGYGMFDGWPGSGVGGYGEKAWSLGLRSDWVVGPRASPRIDFAHKGQLSAVYSLMLTLPQVWPRAVLDTSVAAGLHQDPLWPSKDFAQAARVPDSGRDFRESND